jgi:DNA-binding response OmpR family regulator
MTDTKVNILLVDDDKFLLDMYSMKFVQQGYNVQACLSVTSALDTLRQGFSPQVILFDLVMPEVDGFGFLQKMREAHLGDGAIKIALTNQSTDVERGKVSELGADQFIVKATMIPSEVVNSVAEAISKKRAA